jgi:hypothetical protein
MSLPDVSGWLIDFLTAQSIFDSGSNARINHCIEMCSSSDLHICHLEEKFFKGHAALRPPFLTDQNCICHPDQAIMKQCVNVSSNPKCKKLLKGNQTAIVLTAIASCRNYGVISDHRSPFFNTVYDLCAHFGVPIFSSEEYFDLLP